jgi:molybdenum cofactor synthesis domain-containing protein
VVPVESVRVDGGLVRVTGPVTRGSHVYRPGDDVKKGQVLLRRGQTIRAQDVGLLVSLGFRRAKVWRKARVSIVATGSELTSPTRPKAGKVVNSHSPLFVSLLAELGCVPVDLGIAEDDTGRIARSIRHGLSRSDLVLTLGGTSAGRHDQVEQALAGLDPDLLIHGIKMDRGRVSGVSIVKGKPVLMLPGPIQGAMNALLLLGLPIIEAISGAQGRGTEVPCVFSRAWEARERYADFRKVVYVKRGGGPELTANPLDAETESMKLLAEADAYAVIPENVTRIEQGDKVMVRLLPGFSF